MWRAALLLLSLAVSAGSGQAEDGQDLAALVAQGFDTWRAEHGLTGAVALVHDRTVLLSHGDMADAPRELASLAKAVTAVCLGTLVAEGRVGWEDRFDAITGQGPSVTLGALVTHSAGLWPDGTQIAMHAWLDRPEPRWASVLRIVEARGWARGVAGEYRYNNENYALLGLAIEQLTARPYAVACRDRVLAPAGARGHLSPRSGAFGPWGGWVMSVADYARFHHHWFGPGAARPDVPLQDLGQGLSYGAGVLHRPVGTGANRWHYGALCFPGRMAAGSFAVTLVSGHTLVAAYDACPDSEVLRNLERQVLGALIAPSEGEGQ